MFAPQPCSGETKKVTGICIVNRGWKRTQALRLLEVPTTQSLCPRSDSRRRTTLPRWNLHSIFFLYANVFTLKSKDDIGECEDHMENHVVLFYIAVHHYRRLQKLWSRVQSRVEVSFPTNPSLKCILPLKTPPLKYNSSQRAFGRETHFWPTSNWRAVLLKRIQAPGQCAAYFTGKLCSEWPFTVCRVRTNHWG